MKIFNKNNILQKIDDAILELQSVRDEYSRMLANPMALADAAYNQGYRLYLLNKEVGGKPPLAEYTLVVSDGDDKKIEISGGESGNHDSIVSFVKKYVDVEPGEYWVIPLDPNESTTVESAKMPDGKVEKAEDDYEPISVIDNSTLIYPVDHDVVKSIDPFATIQRDGDSINQTVSPSLTDKLMIETIKHVIQSQKSNLLNHLTDGVEYGIYITNKDVFAQYTSKLVDVDLGGRGKVVNSPSSRYQTIAVLRQNGGVSFRIDDDKLQSIFGRGKPIFAIKQKVSILLEKQKKQKSTAKVLYFVVDK